MMNHHAKSCKPAEAGWLDDLHFLRLAISIASENDVTAI